MRLTITKNTLLDAIKTVKPAVLSNSPMMALCGILVEVNADSIKLAGSDANIVIEKLIKPSEDYTMEIEDEGVFLLNGNDFEAVVSKIDGDEIVIYEEGKVIHFNGNKVKFKLNSMNAMDYPAYSMDYKEEFYMPSREFKWAVNSTVFAVAVKDYRPVLTGVNFNYNDGVLKMTATDSYRLTVISLEYPLHQFDMNVTIPGNTLKIVNRLVPEEEGNVMIGNAGNAVIFKTGNNTVVRARLLDGGYPETAKLIPSEFTAIAEVNRDVFLQSLKRGSFLKIDNMSIMKLEISEDSMVISARSMEIGDFREEISDFHFEGEPLTISFSSKYMIEALSALEGKTIQLKFVGDMRPFLAVDPEKDNITELVLPVRTYA